MSRILNLNSSDPAATDGNALASWQLDPAPAGTDPTTGDPYYNASAQAPNSGGVAVKTASYSAALADNGTLLSFASSGAATLTLIGAWASGTYSAGFQILDPAGHIQKVTTGGTTGGSIPTFNDAGGTTTDSGVIWTDQGSGARWRVQIQNVGAGALTISRNGLLIDGAAADVTIPAGSGLALYTDGANYFTERGSSGGVTAAQIQQESLTAATDTGAANAYAITLSPAPTIGVNSRIQFKAAHANTGPSTVAVNGTTYPLTKEGANPLQSGDISLGQMVDAICDGTGFQAIGLAPATVLTPVIRGSSSLYTSASSITVALPAGAQAGDLTILFATSGWVPTNPSGWTNLYIQTSGRTWFTLCSWRILTSGDISTGTVTVSFSGSTDCLIGLVSFIGATGGIRETQADLTATGTTPITLTTTSAVQNTDAAIYFSTIQAGIVPTITPGSGSAATLQSPSGAYHALIADQAMPGGALAVAYNYPSIGVGSQSACIQVIVEGIASSVGTVTSVGLTMPSDFTVSGSPVTGGGTLAVTGGVTKSGVQQESYTYGTDTGAADAYAVTLSPAPTLVAGSECVFIAANTNTGASTLAVNGGSAIAIKKNGNATALAAGDIAASELITCKYDGTVWQLQVPGTGGGAGFTLTTTGSSGASTLVGTVLNVPNYSAGGSSIGLPLTAPVAASFSWINQGGASLDSSNNQLAILAPATAGESWRIQEVTLPGAYPWTLTAAIIAGPVFQNNNNGVGIGIKDSGNNKIVVFKGQCWGGSNMVMAVTEYSNATSGVSNHKIISFGSFQVYLIWLRIVADATNFTFKFSPNGGISWITFDVMARTLYLTSPATAFFGVNADSVWPNAASLVSWTLV